MRITLGFTQHHLAEKDENGRVKDYAPFWDPYLPGTPQYRLTLTVDYEGDETPEELAAQAFAASNALGALGQTYFDESLPAKLQRAIVASGYHGEQAHFSLSVGDTVTVSQGAEEDVTLACTREGWEHVALEVAVLSYGNVWNTIKETATYLDDEAVDTIADAVMNKFVGPDPVHGAYQS